MDKALPITDIDPHRLYPLREAASLIPSSHMGKTTHPESLKRWARAGLLTPVFRMIVKKRLWFFRGSELIRFLGADEPPVVERSPSEAERQRDFERDARRARELGLLD